LHEALDFRAAAPAWSPGAVIHVESRAFGTRISCASRSRDDRTNRGKEAASLRRVESRGTRARIDLRAPERFGRIDISESGDDALIEQSDLDRDSTTGKRRAKARRCQRGIARLGA